ncbi:MAG: carbohydrate binding domain-containing protein, partial [Chloroflexota bacterium]
GNPFPVDADENGIVDDPEAFDAAWRAGVLHELRTLRTLLPHAIFSGHAMDIYDPNIQEIFNGIGVGFVVPEIIEGQTDFQSFWQRYQAWMTDALTPQITLIESAVPYQIGYGYGYLPQNDMPQETWDFARDYYPYMRFGLALTLMQDGYFTHEIGDTYHGNDWWYDELDFDLGYPLGEAQYIIPTESTTELIYEETFEQDFTGNWSFWVDTGAGYAASVVSENDAARIDITETTGEDWRIDLARYGHSLVEGQTYQLSFRARANQARTMTISSNLGQPDWRNLGLHQIVQLTTDWQSYDLRFTANEITSQARLQFLLGASTGTVWIDDLTLTTATPDILMREFENGLVLLNATPFEQTLNIGTGYQRLIGTQASLAEYIIDDTPDVFTTIGDWSPTVFDTDLWIATPPYYHDWGVGSHLGERGSAQWDLNIPFADTYTVTAWLPATPAALSWHPNAQYQIISGGEVVAVVSLDQRTSDDTWHFLAEVALESDAMIQLICHSDIPCLADAFHIRSDQRYNNGEITSQVTLQPMDGIILQRTP